MIGTQTLKELRTHISHLRELGDTAAEHLSEVSSFYHLWGIIMNHQSHP